MAKRRVIHIDTSKQEVTETTVETLEDMQKLVGGYIERAFVFENGDELYVDEEGLLKTPDEFFHISVCPHPYAGSAYIIGSVTPAGNNRDAKTTVAQVKASIAFRRFQTC